MEQLVGLGCSRQFRVWTLTASWIFLSEQGDEIATDEQPTIQAGHILSRIYNSTAQSMAICQLTMQQLHILHCTFHFHNYTNCDQLHAKICPAFRNCIYLSLTSCHQFKILFSSWRNGQQFPMIFTES